MNLLQALLRLISSQTVAPVAKSPVALQPELLKSVSGGDGGTTAPRSSW
jgi:hypothetical protein